MQETKHYKTAPEDRVSNFQKFFYGVGSLVNNLLGAAIGTMVIVLNLGLGINPALVGTLVAIPRLTDAFTDPIMGYISDHTSTRFGRRRPYIFFGAIFAGIAYMMLWQLFPGRSESFYFWYFLIGSIVFYLGYTVFAAPWIALGYELTPDYHERTRLMGVSNWLGQFAWIIAPWFYKIMEYDAWFDDSIQGARGLSIMIGIFVIIAGVLPAIFCRERYSSLASKEAEESRRLMLVKRGRRRADQRLLDYLKEFFKGFGITLRCRPFVMLCIATFLVFNGFMLISGFSSYIIIFYIFGGNNDMGATYMGWFGLVSSISTLCVIPLITWVSTKVGKRNAFFITIFISILGYALRWFCYNPDAPFMVLFPAPLLAFGLGGLFTLMGAMIADVCDWDELETGNRREGMFGAVYWWMVKLGMALAFALSGHLLNATGFDVALGGDQAVRTLFLMRVFDIGVPIITSIIAILAVTAYEITEEKAHRIRYQLEKRRGKPALAT